MMNYGYGYGPMMDGWGWLGGLFMLLFGAIAITVIVLLVIWAVRSGSDHVSPTSGTPASRHPDEAISIARRRLASGELTKEQYDEIMRSLGG